MKASELIAELSKYQPDVEVVVSSESAGESYEVDGVKYFPDLPCCEDDGTEVYRAPAIVLAIA